MVRKQKVKKWKKEIEKIAKKPRFNREIKQVSIRKYEDQEVNSIELVIHCQKLRQENSKWVLDLKLIDKINQIIDQRSLDTKNITHRGIITLNFKLTQ